MIDAQLLKDRTDLLALVGQNVTLRRHASTRGGEWVGPCPFCHSDHRIHVQPASCSDISYTIDLVRTVSAPGKNGHATVEAANAV